ncbi:DUF819 family protein [Cecembia sp.]|uniref:DUF819 family protein n=1 Tax=Cecembia sp. TaxID=1898110 RepID=UPI0025C63B30|nr:DUF819 family protein [Cecembia sp.]
MNQSLILLLLFYILSPTLILYLCHRFTLAEKIGPVIIAYVIGLLLGNIGLLPSMKGYLNEYLITYPKTTAEDVQMLQERGLVDSNELLGFLIYQLKDNLMSITVLLAIPLMLFSTDIQSWKKLAGKTIISLFIGLLSVLAVISIGFFLFRNSGLSDLWKISGLLVGVYTGGTPNLASLKLMLDVDANTYILTHTYDLIIGVLYLGFLLSLGKNIFVKFLPPFPKNKTSLSARKPDEEIQLNLSSKIISVLKGLGLALLIAGLSLLLASLLPDHLLMVTVILCITTLGLLASSITFIKNLPLSFDVGMYLILIFSVVVASMADITNFTNINPFLLAYISLAVFGSLAFHLLLSRIFKIDADTTMITSVSFICSPPFVPVIAGALGNKQVIVSGITIGIIGYALGNYLGYFLAHFLKLFL